MKNQALFSSKDKSKKLKCRLLQLLFSALRVNRQPVFSSHAKKSPSAYIRLPTNLVNTSYYTIHISLFVRTVLNMPNATDSNCSTGVERILQDGSKRIAYDRTMT